ncbi:RecBCD enzyme subunit RecB [Eubacterium plexicaudatum ASF492]|nr:RecBCD enzyme subunit RecB [Eubacterium plexicaudatum ASF492]
MYDSIFQQMGVGGYLPYDQKYDRLTSEKIFEADDAELMQCVPCHGKDEETFFHALFGILENQTGKIADIMEQKRAQGKTLSLEERTIAILVRSNWQVESIVKEAYKREVNVEIKSGGDLFQLESTQDFYKLILAIENSTNPVYLVNFIESNYTDLKLDYQKYHGISEAEKLQSLQKILDEFFMLRMKKRWQEVLDEVYAHPVLYALKHIYDALEPWKIYSRNPSAQTYYMANYDYLLEKIVKFSRIDTLTINQMAKYLETNILTRQQELARTPDADEEGIHIMCTTVHKSKGLEYGTVVLPYTAEDISDIRKVKLGANYSKGKLSYTVQFENKVRERNSNYNEDMEKTEQIAEESRILYVALTRAIRNCVWIMNIDKNVPISWGTLMEE